MSISTTGEGLLFTDTDGIAHLWAASDADSVHFSRRTEEIVLPDPPVAPKPVIWNDDT